MTLLRFDGVSKKYPGDHQALDNVSFSVQAGEMLFITGHSGAGKSTLLKMAHLSERPTRARFGLIVLISTKYVEAKLHCIDAS